MVRTEGCVVRVSQRLKRIPTILDKLARHPTMALSTMQDIGGSRAILDNVQELRRVQQRIERRRPPISVDDYVSSPRSSGYRAVHIVVQYDSRAIEIQLRTHLMHDWAVAVERLGGRIDSDLKSGDGPSDVLAWLKAVSEAMGLEEDGMTVDASLRERISMLREAAIPYVSEASR